MPFKACAPRALPPDVAPPLWESNGPFPSAARPPPANPAPEGRPRPRGSGSIQAPGARRGAGWPESRRGAEGVGGSDRPHCAATARLGIPKFVQTVAAAAAQVPFPLPNPKRTPSSRSLVIPPRVLRRARAGGSSQPSSHRGERGAGRAGAPGSPELSSEKGLGFFSGSLSPLPRQTEIHIHTQTRTKPYMNKNTPLLFHPGSSLP